MVTDKRRGFSIRIFLPNGSPEGVRVIEKSNWSGQGVVCPRSMFSEAKSRVEFGKTGVYALVGPIAVAELPRIYIGEGDPVRPRLEQHAAKKDFWTSLILFTSKDANLNKAHVQYLEARLVQLAQDAKRCELDNGNRPDLPSLSEAEEAEMEGFLDEMRLCFPVLGVTVFERPSALSPGERILSLKSKGIEARGYESVDGFVVMAGSQAVGIEVPSLPSSVAELRKSLVDKGVFKQTAGAYTSSEDYAFSSPSLAAAVFLARTANGRTEWRDQSGRTLREIQEASS